MALGKINDPHIPDIRKLNKLLQQVETLRQKVTVLESTAANHTTQIDKLATNDEPATFNNVVFTWTGGTLTLSWTAGYVQTKDGTRHTIDAGSRVLSASTYYWCAWDVDARRMAFNSSLQPLFSDPDTFTLCQVFTGTGAQTGTAGGGGSAGGGTDLSGSNFKNF